VSESPAPAIASPISRWSLATRALSTNRIRRCLLVYGLALALFGIWYLDAHLHNVTGGLNGARQTQIHAAVDMLKASSPPLLGPTNSSTQFVPLATDDDRGGVLYLSLAGFAFGTDNVNSLLKWFFIAQFVPLLLLYPFLLYELFDSILASLAAPFILLFGFPFTHNQGIYWSQGWAVLLLLPVVLLLYKKWAERNIWLLCAVAVVASFASSIRGSSGLPVLLSSIAVVFLRVPSWSRRLAVVAMLAVAYLSISNFAIHAIQTHRDAVVGVDMTTPYPSGHVVWHTAYVGLGYLNNPYGLKYKDEVAVAAAERAHPGVIYGTKAYENTVRGLFLSFVKHHPGFVIRSYLEKASVSIRHAFEQFPLAFLLVPLMLVVGPNRRLQRSYVLLTVPALLITAASPIVSIPLLSYEVGWLATWGLLLILAVGWLGGSLEQGLRSLAHRGDQPLADLIPVPTSMRRIVVGICLAATAGAVAAVVSSTGRVTELRGLYHDRAATLVPSGRIHGKPVRAWRFTGGLPARWETAVAGTKISADPRGARVATTRSQYSYQFVSPQLLLGPGVYNVSADGSVLKGALGLLVVDRSTTDKTVAESIYPSTARFGAKRRMVASFQLVKPTPIRIIFENFSLYPQTSIWSLRSVEIKRTVGLGCRVILAPQPWFAGAVS